MFLDALSQLEHSNMLLQQHSGLSAVSQALTHSQKVFNRALEQCDTDFRTTLAISSRSCAPSLSWLRSNLDVQITGIHNDLNSQMYAPCPRLLSECAGPVSQHQQQHVSHHSPCVRGTSSEPAELPVCCHHDLQTSTEVVSPWTWCQRVCCPRCSEWWRSC